MAGIGYIMCIPGRTGSKSKGRREVIRMRIQVMEIVVPGGSTIGIGRGFPEGDKTKVVTFGGDWRQMVDVAMLAAGAEAVGEELVIEIPDWAVLDIRELP